MSCYFRHLQGVLAEAGIKVTPENKKEIDRAIHKMVNVTYKDCPQAWKAVKNEIADAAKRQEFIRQLKNLSA